jgi:hypothetical protein
MKSGKILSLALTAFSSLAVTDASAQLLLGEMYSTGYAGSTKLSAGSADPLFEIVSQPPLQTGTLETTGTPYSAVVAGPIPPEWVVVSGAQFISPTTDQTYSPPTVAGDLPGQYDYQTYYKNTSTTPVSVTVSGEFAGDDYATVSFDGTQIGATPTGPTGYGYGQLTSFSMTFEIYPASTEIPLDFYVHNLDDTQGNPNPTGLLVSDLEISLTAPEPSAVVLLLGGAGLLCLIVMRRNRSIA